MSRKDDAGVRFYRLPDGLELPSVTSIIKVMSKDGLMSWAGRRGVEETVAWFEQRIDDAAGAGGDLSTLLLPTLTERQELARTHEREADEAAARGDAVHSAVEQRILGRSAPANGYPRSIAGHMAMFEQFLDTVRPEWTATEQTVFDRDKGYIGTLDARARINGQDVVLDLKTSKSEARPEWALQVAAYAHAPRVLRGGVESDAPGHDAGMVLRLRPRSWQLRRYDIGPLTYRGFLFARGLWHWNYHLSDAVVGDVLYRNA